MLETQKSKSLRLPSSKKLFLLPALFLLVSAGGIIGVFFQPPGLQFFFQATGLSPGGGSDHPMTTVAPAVTAPVANINTTIKALGRLRPYDDVAIVAPPFGSGDARIAKIIVEEGQFIDAGDVIAELDNLEQLASSVKIAEANLEVANATLAQTESQVGSSLKDLIAQRDSADEDVRVAEISHKRIVELHSRGVVSIGDFEQSELAVTKAKNVLEQTEAQLERISGGKSQSDIQLALSRLKLAKTNLEQASVELRKGYVRAPQSGTIISLLVRVGERPGNSGVALLGKTRTMQAELEVYQTDIMKVTPGASVKLTSPALSTALNGVVTRVGMNVERQSIVGSSPAANLDARIVRVMVDLDEASSLKAQFLTGLDITATVQVE